MFKEFYTAPTPVVICEGKTDNVYITHAIRSLAVQYPNLAEIDSAGKITIKLRRFRYTDSSTRKKPDVSDPYTHIFGNLYLVTTPLLGGENPSTIEDFFDESMKGKVLNGKTFSLTNDFSRDTNYGKADFAYKVVKPNADSIDFSGFKPILDRFVGVLDEHARRFPHATST